MLLVLLILANCFFHGTVNGQFSPFAGSTSIVNDCNTCQYNLQFLSFREKRFCCSTGFVRCCSFPITRPNFPEEKPEFPIIDLPFREPPNRGFSNFNRQGQGSQSNLGLNQPDVATNNNRPSFFRPVSTESRQPTGSQSFSEQPQGHEVMGSESGFTGRPRPPKIFSPEMESDIVNPKPLYSQNQPTGQLESNGQRFGLFSIRNPILQGIIVPILSGFGVLQTNPSTSNENHHKLQNKPKPIKLVDFDLENPSKTDKIRDLERMDGSDKKDRYDNSETSIIAEKQQAQPEVDLDNSTKNSIIPNLTVSTPITPTLL